LAGVIHFALHPTKIIGRGGSAIAAMQNALKLGARAVDLSLTGRMVESVETVFRGRRDTVRLAVAALLGRGHILLEDIPGVGKTTLARALAQTLGLGFRRIQFTSDLLPSDVLGVSIFNPRTGDFETRSGPIFTQIVLADEINRAPPRTQSGLLEAMQEGRVTIDERTYDLPRPFLVIATQNPLEQHGTYDLPESQLDRFLMRLSIGYPDPEEEREILLRNGRAGFEVELEPVVGAEQLIALQEEVDRVHADSSLVDYTMELVAATRRHPALRVGVSTRGAIALFRAARAYALVEGRRFLIPDDVQRLVVPCFAHRVVPASGLGAGPTDAVAEVLDEIVGRVAVPV
jgi:MoxR-like ATPase